MDSVSLRDDCPLMKIWIGATRAAVEKNFDAEVSIGPWAQNVPAFAGRVTAYAGVGSRPGCRSGPNPAQLLPYSFITPERAQNRHTSVFILFLFFKTHRTPPPLFFS